MATKLQAQFPATNALSKCGAPTFEEIFIRNDVVSLCLLLNRRARSMRVIDFRAGASPAKRQFVQSIARKEGIEKIVALVERDECATWSRLGFLREGNIPGFYKRSDAHIMGCVVPAIGEFAESPPRVRPGDSGIFTVGRHNAFISQADDDDDAPAPAASAAAEKTVVQARKLARELAKAPLLPVKILQATSTEVGKRVLAATKEHRALTGFEPFGRDITREDHLVSSRGFSDLVIGAEVQRCYNNAFVEVLTAPRDDRERGFLIAALHATCEQLLAKEIVSAFGVTPADNVRMATAFAANGFRRTGLLRQHVRVQAARYSRESRNERADAILWTRKLATLQGDE